MRLLRWFLVIAMVVVVFLAARGSLALPPRIPPQPEPMSDGDWALPNPVENQEVIHLRQENARLRGRVSSLKRTLLHQADVVEAINLACTIYGNCATLWRKARCESHLYRYAANRHSSARGLFQFLTTPHGGTWGSTPFGRFSVYSPYANALAAGWMHTHGRGGEWVCR